MLFSDTECDFGDGTVLILIGRQAIEMKRRRDFVGCDGNDKGPWPKEKRINLKLASQAR